MDFNEDPNFLTFVREKERELKLKSSTPNIAPVAQVTRNTREPQSAMPTETNAVETEEPRTTT